MLNGYMLMRKNPIILASIVLNTKWAFMHDNIKLFCVVGIKMCGRIFTKQIGFYINICPGVPGLCRNLQWQFNQFYKRMGSYKFIKYL